MPPGKVTIDLTEDSDEHPAASNIGRLTIDLTSDVDEGSPRRTSILGKRKASHSMNRAIQHPSSAEYAQNVNVGTPPSQSDILALDEAFAYNLQLQFDREYEQAQSNNNLAIALPEPIEPPLYDSPTFFACSNYQNQDSKRASSFNLQRQYQLPVFAQQATENSSILPLPVEVVAEFSAIKYFGQSIRSNALCGCGHNILPDLHGTIFAYIKGWLRRELNLDSSFLCSACATWTCLGCGRPHPQPDENLRGPNASRSTIPITRGCDQGRLFLIWLVLCALDVPTVAFVQQPARPPPPSQPFAVQPGPSKSSKLSPRKRPSNGIGYGGTRLARGESTTTSQKSVKDDIAEQNMSMAFRALGFLLPSSDAVSSFDINPPEVLSPILKYSSIMRKITEFLRQRSLSEILDKSDLFNIVLDVISRLGNHLSTAETLFCARLSLPNQHKLLDMSFADRLPNTPPHKNEMVDLKKELLSNVLKIREQCDILLRKAASKPENFQTADNEKHLRICQKIREFADFFEANAGVSSAKKENGQSGETMEQYHRDNCVLDVTDEVIFQDLHGHFVAEANSSTEMTVKGRMKRLITELASLRADLPFGIFVRHGESRLDVMKILIIGPKGTPYDGGIFEFDLLCPADYPQRPPNVQFRTTGGGRYGLNPNLYSNGKVCLSLLGTWKGEPWNPKQSTILQVLVSIQAMIFCEHPFCNEPGRENLDKTPQSNVYNQGIRAMTARFGILNWAQGKHAAIWKDVVEQYLKQNGDEILQTVKAWKADSASTRHPFSMLWDSLIPNLEKALEKLKMGGSHEVFPAQAYTPARDIPRPHGFHPSSLPPPPGPPLSHAFFFPPNFGPTGPPMPGQFPPDADPLFSHVNPFAPGPTHAAATAQSGMNPSVNKHFMPPPPPPPHQAGPQSVGPPNPMHHPAGMHWSHHISISPMPASGPSTYPMQPYMMPFSSNWHPPPRPPMPVAGQLPAPTQSQAQSNSAALILHSQGLQPPHQPQQQGIFYKHEQTPQNTQHQHSMSAPLAVSYSQMPPENHFAAHNHPPPPAEHMQHGDQNSAFQFPTEMNPFDFGLDPWGFVSEEEDFEDFDDSWYADPIVPEQSGEQA